MQKNLLDPLRTLFSEIDFFLVTYNSVKLPDLLSDFKPRDVMIFPETYGDKFKLKAVNILVSESMNLIETYAKEYDYILCTRFDLYYYKPLDIGKIRLDCFNFAWVGPDGQADDQWLLFSTDYIGHVRDYFKEGNVHYLNSTLSNCNYVCKLEPEKGYHMPNFYFIYRCLPEIGKSITLFE
jgi:hypothetical protein